MKENSIGETIKQLKLMLKVRKEQKEIIECAGGSCINCDPDIKALSESIDILSDYKRVLKENEELLEVKVSTSAHNRILELEKENEELKNDYENLNNSVVVKNHCIKNSIPVQKVKDKIEELKQQNIFTTIDFIKTTPQDIKNTVIQELQELLEGRK